MDSLQFSTEDIEVTALAEASAKAEPAGSEQYRDLAKIRLVLKSTCDQLRSRELVYLLADSSSIGVAGLHADCLFVLSTDVECEALRAAHATAAILVQSAARERHQLWRRTLEETGGLWMDYYRTVARLCCRIEAVFLRKASRFAVKVDAEGAPCWESGAAAAEARQLWLLADIMGGLDSRMGLALSPEFDACRGCLHRYLSRQGQQQLDVGIHLTARQRPLEGYPELQSPAVQQDGQQKGQQPWLLGAAWLSWQRAGSAAKAAIRVVRRLQWTPGLFVACVGGCFVLAVATGQFQAFCLRLVCWDWRVCQSSFMVAEEDPY